MVPEMTVVGIDVSRDRLDGYCLPDGQRFQFANTATGHEDLIAFMHQLPSPVVVGFEATGGLEWRLWTRLEAAGVDAGQVPPAHIKAFAKSRGTRAKTDRIDAALIAHFMLFRPDARRRLPTEKVRILRALTTKRAQLVDTRKRLITQTKARNKQSVPADLESMDEDLKVFLDTQVKTLERRIEQVIGEDDPLAEKAKLLRSIPGIGPVTAATLIADMPELGTMTAAQVAAMTGLAPFPHDSGTMRGKRAIGGGRRSLRRVLFQAALTAARYNPNLETVALRLRKAGKPHKVIMVAIARRLIVTANAILKTAAPWTLQGAP
jgi:transposase